MKFLRVNPYSLSLTDPLLELQNRRKFIYEHLLAADIAPVLVFPEENGFYNIFNGNKRTVIAREIGTLINASIIENNNDLWSAQRSEPRNLPSELRFDFESVREYLSERAIEFARYNDRHMPLPLSQGLRLFK